MCVWQFLFSISELKNREGGGEAHATIEVILRYTFFLAKMIFE